MGTVSENMEKYGEEMIGKFSHKPYGRNGIEISAIKPFFEEIHIDCDNDFYQEYSELYLLLEPQEDHPSLRGSNKRAYYNTQDKCYYRSDWKIEPKQTENEGKFTWVRTPIWVRTDTEYIRVHTIRYERLQAHFRRYSEIHKGQLCIFTGYAVDPNGNPKRPSTVESMFERHNWYYHPFSFKVKPLDKNTIDDFVKETPISKEMTDKMVRHHRSERNKKRQVKIRDFCQNLKDKLSKPWKSFTKQENLTKILIITNIISILILIWWRYLKKP